MKYFTLILIIAFISCKQTDKDNKKIPSQNQTAVILQSPADCDYHSRKTQCKKLFTAYNTNTNQNNRKLTEFFIDSLLQC